MELIIDERKISEKDKARPPERSERISAERSNKNESSTTS